MDLKTDEQVHYHGADGLHAGVDPETGKLLLYWGESKIFNDVQGAVYECVKSLKSYLTAQGEEKRDLQLLGRYLDLDDPALEEALRNFLDPDNPAFLAVEYSGLCLVGFDSDTYPAEPNTKTIEHVVSEITILLPEWKDYITKRLGEDGLGTFHIHIFCIPIPSADAFRKRFRERLGFKDDD